ncbi:MAG: translocation/assembly module TamB domain-containing protein, partial [Candidatus Aminicenantes bacterium]|nr:translocation/assembly module TamB domain-containing protein [Candidatus Aminicenantes bacterium]
MKVIPNQKDKAKKKRRIRLWRWPAFIFIIFCLLLLFLLIGTLLIIPTNKASQWFLRQLNQKLQADFSIVIEANSLKFDIWRGYFQAQDLIIRRIESRDKQHKKLEKRPTGISSEPFLYLKKISINLGLLGLFRKKLHFEEVLIDSPSLKLEALNSREKENNSFVSYPVKSPEKERPKKAWRLQINYFQLNGGRIDFSLEQWITQFIFQNVNIEINFDETKKEHRGLFSLEKGEVFSKNQLALLLISTQVDFRFNKREIFFDRVFLNGKGLSIKGNGRLVFEPNIIVDQIKFKGEVNLEEIPFFNGSPSNYLIINSFLNQQIQAEIDSEIKNKNRLRIEKIKRGSLEENWSRKKITSKGRIDFSLNLISEEGGLKGEFQFTGQEIIFRVSEEKTRGKVVASGLSSKERKIKLAEIKKAKERLALEQQELLLEKELPILLTLPFLQGEAKGAIKKEKIYLECFRLDLPGVQLSSFGFYDKQKYFEANIELDFKDIGQTFRDLGLKDFISNQVDLFKETIDMQRKEIISGELKIRGFFSGYWPAVQGELEFLGINLAGPFWEKGELNLKASIRDKKINFSQFDFLSPHWEFNLGGFLSFTSIEDNFRQGSDLRAKLKIKDIAKLSKFFFPNNLALEGAIALETRLSGNLKKPRINFKIEAKDLIIDSDSLGAFEIIGKINPPLIAFADFRLKKSQEALPIQGNFFYDLEKKDLLIKIDCPYQNLADFSWLQKIWPIQGWLSFSLEARGIKNQINLSYKLNGNNLQAKYFSFNNLESEGKAFFKIRKWQLDPVSISADLRPTGLTIYSIPIETPEPIKFELREETLFISGFKLKGESFEFNLEGSLGFEKEKGKLHLEAQLPLDFINRYLELEIREKISARGKIVINGAIRGSFRNWTPDINLELKDGYLSSSLLRVPIEKISLLAQLREEALKLEELNLHFGRGSIFIQAQIPLFFSKRRTDFFMKNSRFTNNKMENIERKLEEAEISLVFSQLNPFDFFEKAMAKLPIEYQRKIKEGEIGGEISGVIKFNFRPILSAWLSTFKAEGRIDPLKIKFDSLLLSNEKPIVFRVTPEILILEESAIRAENLELDFRGVVKNPLKFKLWEKERLTNNFSQGLQHERLTQVKIKHQSETQTQNSLETLIDFNLRASANLEILRIFLENVDLRGLVALNFNLSGSIDKVKTKVFGEIRGVSFKSLELPFRLSDTTGTFFFDGRKLDIQSCRGLANGAAWEIAGFLELGDSLSFRPGYKPTLNSGFIQIEAKEIPFELEGVGATQVSLKLNLEPRKIAAIQEKRWFLVGEMNFKKTVLLADIGPITRFARPRKPLPKRAVGPSLPSFFENLNLNLRLNLDEPILISNPFLRTEIHGAVTLNGLATQPSLLGRLVNRGEGELLWGERRYRLEKMQIDLTGVFPLEPRLEIVAKTELIHRFNKFEISLHLTGPVSDLNFTLSSTPKLSQEEIALILFTGRSPDKFRTQGLEALRDQLLLTMAIPAASQLGSAIKRLFGLEEVRLEPLGIADETDPGARLTMVKQISPAARVTGSIDITNSQRQTWVIDYRLTQGIMFQGLRFDNGSFAVS